MRPPPGAEGRHSRPGADFVLKYAARLSKPIGTIPKHTLDALTAYAWPGNVRELANIIERSVIVSRGPTLELGDSDHPWAPTLPQARRRLCRTPSGAISSKPSKKPAGG